MDVEEIHDLGGGMDDVEEIPGTLVSILMLLVICAFPWDVLSPSFSSMT